MSSKTAPQFPLANWTWGALINVMSVYSKQLKEIQRLSNSVGIERLEIDIDYPDLKNIFILRALRDVKRLDQQVAVVQQEIARRQSLVGVL